MSDQDSDHIPSIIPERDELASYQRQKNSRPKSDNGSTGGAGIFARLFITVALIAGAVACAWAFQLQAQLERAGALLNQYEKRIADLEDRLSDTDESVSQSGVAMQVKIKELYFEVDKLWASAWRKNKADIDANKNSAASNTANLKTQKKTQKEQLAKLVSVDARLDKLDKLTGSISQMSENRRQLEKLGDQLYSLNLDYAQLKKRVSTNEEWVESINGFRKQVNRNMSHLQQSVGQLQGEEPLP